MTDSRQTPIRRALISVHDKTGLVPFAKSLSERGVHLVSTGGTARALAEAGLPVTDVASLTGFPEMLDGRVKTLHPAVHAGILARRDTEGHLAALDKHDLSLIDLVVVNLYPFQATVASGAGWDDCIENIDIGGPSMIRGAAKNHAFVTVVTSPDEYAPLLAEMDANAGATTETTRRRLAGYAYARTSAYDSAISGWMAQQRGDRFPETLTLAGERRQLLRYGENPHQLAAFYATGDSRKGVASATQLQGKELSYNNLNDTDAAFECLAEFDEPSVVIVKHANPCGVASGVDLKEAYQRALACDPVSAFGGIIAVNRTLDAATAELLASLFAEVIIAPEFSDEARAVLARKTQLRLLATGGMPDPGAPAGLTYRSIAGGFLVQDNDRGRVAAPDLKIVTKRAPSPAELADMLFAWRVAKHVKSNAIVYAKGAATVGIGAGQMSRVDSSRIAAWKAGEAGTALNGADAPSPAVGSVVASDAFFPFADGLLAAAAAGASAIIQPGGSIRDAEVIAAADEKGLAMVFTGMRHFRH